MAKKAVVKKCPIDRNDFLESDPLSIRVGSEERQAVPMEFKTGSFGFFCNDKIVVKVGDKVVRLQANLVLTVIGSKEA